MVKLNYDELVALTDSRLVDVEDKLVDVKYRIPLSTPSEVLRQLDDLAKKVELLSVAWQAVENAEQEQVAAEAEEQYKEVFGDEEE